jgi:hypothetical protein
MNVSIKNGIVGIQGNSVKGRMHKPQIKSVVNVAVDPGSNVEVNGSGVKAISKVALNGQTTKFSKFASFRL